jgi:hypothetical protein
MARRGWLVALFLALACVSCTQYTTRDCSKLCEQPDADPPTNTCLVVGGEHHCIYTCKEDADCPAVYAGCKAKADDGSKLCAASSRTLRTVDSGAR